MKILRLKDCRISCLDKLADIVARINVETLEIDSLAIGPDLIKEDPIEVEKLRSRWLWKRKKLAEVEDMLPKERVSLPPCIIFKNNYASNWHSENILMCRWLREHSGPETQRIAHVVGSCDQVKTLMALNEFAPTHVSFKVTSKPQLSK